MLNKELEELEKKTHNSYYLLVSSLTPSQLYLLNEYIKNKISLVLELQWKK